MYGENSFYRDYENLLIKNDELSKENRSLKYNQKLLENQIKTLEKNREQRELELAEKEKLIGDKDFEIARLNALLNMDGNNHGIPTSQTPINKVKRIPNTREKTDRPKGGQKGHKKSKLEKFDDKEVTEVCEHNMEHCPYCNSEDIEKTGEVKEKDELDYKIVIEKRRHRFIEYKCEECGKKFHQNIPNNLKEDNQYGAQVQALELTLINQANVTINKAQKITYGMTDGEINLSEGYIAKLQKRAAETLEDFMKETKIEIIKQKLLHWDDTVIMINKKRGCLRFYGTERLAYYTAHLHKDKDGLDEDGILQLLPEDTIVEHDHNKVNYNKDYRYQNAECNRHLITDLKKVTENLGHSWSSELTELLATTNKKREELIKKGIEGFTQGELNEFEDKFEKIMIKANSENESETQKYYVSEEQTLIVRILDFKNQYLLWVYNFDVPFTNNLSERGVRGAKSKQKASGQFWSERTASWYATIKTYIEICNRNNVNVYNALMMLCLGKPYTLKEILSGELE